MVKKLFRLPASQKPVTPKSFTSQSLRILVWHNALAYSRFVISISKRVDKRATKRNRYRRVLSQIVCDNFLPLSLPCDMIITLKNNAGGSEALLKVDCSELLNSVIKQFGANLGKT